jgi:hypothetical protein
MTGAGEQVHAAGLIADHFVAQFQRLTEYGEPAAGCASTSTSSAGCRDLGVPAGEPLPRLEGSEQLVTNLLTIEGFAPPKQESRPRSKTGTRCSRVSARMARESGGSSSWPRVGITQRGEGSTPLNNASLTRKRDPSQASSGRDGAGQLTASQMPSAEFPSSPTAAQDTAHITEDPVPHSS